MRASCSNLILIIYFDYIFKNTKITMFYSYCYIQLKYIYSLDVQCHTSTNYQPKITRKLTTKLTFLIRIETIFIRRKLAVGFDPINQCTYFTSLSNHDFGYNQFLHG